MTKFTAKDVVGRLAEKHSADLFVPECKNGPTWFGSHLRLDAWAMKRTWKPETFYGYEVKVSRSDFMKDDKYLAYKDYCNYLYLVCPSGLIAPSEVPDGIGLMYLAKTGTRFFTKIKAPRREVDPADMHTLFMHVLMSRVVVTRYSQIEESKERRFRNWLEGKRDRKELGRLVAYDIRRTWKDLQEKAERAEEAREDVRELEKVYEEFDIQPGSYRVVESLRELLKGRSENKKMDRVKKNVAGILSNVERQLRSIGELSLPSEGVEDDDK